LQVWASIWVQFKKSEVPTKERAQYFGNDEFSSLFCGSEDGIKRFRKVIERYRPDVATEQLKGPGGGKADSVQGG